MKLKALLVLCFGLLLAAPGFAQPSTDEQLAAHYFQNGEFDKAVIYYQKLYQKSPIDLYYKYYLLSLYELKELKDAEKLNKRQIKTYPNNSVYIVDLGVTLTLMGNEPKAKVQFERAIKNLSPDRNSIIMLARAFLQHGHPQFALKTYEQGERITRGMQVFHYEKAEVYGEMGNYEAMIDEYLSLVERNENYLQGVQNVLNRNLAFEENSPQSEMLRQRLLKRIQKNPDQPVFAEMLIWLYLQQKNYAGALIQAKAVDRRMREKGQRLMSLARLCVSAGNYETAVKAYEYVIDKGPQNLYYVECKIERLRVLKQKITTTARYTREDLEKLESSYFYSINELGNSPGTVSLLLDLAHLEAYYLHNPDTAVAILVEAINIPRVKPEDQAACKLELGDILVTKGEIWDASLYYSQVEKAFKYDRIGEQAKFRNARISYYTGDFAWAKAQLDVLKGSTTKLIANDALDLSLLITDNTGIDTTENTLRMFARADLLTYQNKDDQALAVLDSIDDKYPGHALADEILFERYEISMKRRNYEEAGKFLEKLIEGYGYDILADNAVFKLAELNQFYFEDTEKAKELYEKVIVDYPASLFVVEARKRFRYLRGDTLVPGGELPGPEN